jgi:hypothetical protein
MGAPLCDVPVNPIFCPLNLPPIAEPQCVDATPPRWLPILDANLQWETILSNVWAYKHLCHPDQDCDPCPKACNR